MTQEGQATHGAPDGEESWRKDSGGRVLPCCAVDSCVASMGACGAWHLQDEQQTGSRSC
jgi:hypothetical protein